MLKATDIDTIVTGKRLGHAVRALKTPFTRAYFKKEFDASVSDEELEALGAGALRRAVLEGDDEMGCFMAGQIAGLIREERPAAEILRSLCDGAEEVLRGAGQWVK